MNKFFYILFYVISTQYVNAQEINNLIADGGFEEVDSCFYWGASIFKTTNWDAAIHDLRSSTDYFNKCQVNLQSTPWINLDKIKFGSGCVAIQLHTDKPFYREYFQNKHSFILLKDSIYVLEFYILYHYDFNNCGGYVDRVEALLTNTKIMAPVYNGYIPGRIDSVPTFTFMDEFLNDTVHWSHVKFIFKASGKEKFLTIGNFSPDSIIEVGSFSTISPLYNKIAYYLIDEVKLYKASDTIVHDVIPEMPNVFSPNGDGVNDAYSIKNLPENSTIEIFNRWGSRVFTASPYTNNWLGRAPNGEPLAEGVYFAILSYQDENGQLQQQKQTVHLMR